MFAEILEIVFWTVLAAGCCAYAEYKLTTWRGKE